MLRALCLFPLFWCLVAAEERVVVPLDLGPGSSEWQSSDGQLAITASGTFGSNASYLGVDGGINPLAIDDADGEGPPDEWLDLAFGEEAGLAAMEIIWTRGLIRLEGFSADPAGADGNYDGSSSSWTRSQPWTSSNRIVFRFDNPAASRGRTIRVSATDPGRPNPQLTVASLVYDGDKLPPRRVTLVADPGERGQIMRDFGASMLWTIDPTEGWPVEAKEELALKLMSRAGGLGLSRLRFDFGGGDTGTGNQTAEPWTWRFPEPLKTSAQGSFDWSRRAGQQWFLRRSQELGVPGRTLVVVSPPAWMTKNGRAFCSPEIGTSNLDASQYGTFATYLADVVAHFESQEDITFDLISPVNEPEYAWESGSQEGNRATAPEIRAIASAIDSELQSRALAPPPLVEVGDHAGISALLDDSYHIAYNGNPWGGSNNSFGKYREFLADLTSHPDLAGKISPVASYHSYFTDSVSILHGNLRSLLAANAAERGVAVAQTEYSILGSYGPVRDLQMRPAEHIFRTLHKDLSIAGVVAWNWWLALSPHDYKDGLIYTDFNNSSVTDPRLFDSKMQWALAHYSRFIRPGWQRIGAGGLENLGGVLATSWLSPDGKEVAIVAGNLSDHNWIATLSGDVAGNPIREWQPWVTDRGRSLREEKRVTGEFVLAPHSFTTFLGKTSNSSFRLRSAISGPASDLAQGNPVSLTVATTWEDGRYLIPALDSAEIWIFQPVSEDPDGILRAGRYRICRESDGASLFLLDDGAPATGNNESVWDVWPLADNRLLLRDVVSGRVLGPSGPARTTGREPVTAIREDLAATHLWSDGLGTGQTCSFDALVSRWVEVESRVDDCLSRDRLLVRVDTAPLQLSGLPEVAEVTLGEEVKLTVDIRDDERPWTFRLVPSDRDEVVTLSDDSLSLALPKGEASQHWQLVDPGTGEIISLLEDGRPVRVRHVESQTYLAASSPAPGESPAVLTTAPALWEITDEGHGACRLAEPATGRVLAISDGALVLKPGDSTTTRFHLDALIDEPVTINWSHDLGSTTSASFDPEHSGAYQVHVEKGGVTKSLSTRVIVKRTFAQWSREWFGEIVAGDEDHDRDGKAALEEFALGSPPLRADPSRGILLFENGGFVAQWPKNEEALGDWTIEYSDDLHAWETLENVTESRDLIRANLPENPARGFVRLRFQTEEAGGGA